MNWIACAEVFNGLSVALVTPSCAAPFLNTVEQLQRLELDAAQPTLRYRINAAVDRLAPTNGGATADGHV